MTVLIRKYFNMVEIALAVGVLALGVMAIMALLPAALHQNKDTISENYASAAAANIQAYITHEAYSDSQWNESAISSIPSDRAGNDFCDISDTRKVLSSEWYYPDEATGTSSPIPGTENIYDLSGYNASKRGTYGVRFITSDGTDTNIDFTGQVLIWKTQNPYVPGKIAGAGSLKTTGSTGVDRLVGINIEVSWPAEKQYSQRAKAYYYFEIFNYGLYSK